MLCARMTDFDIKCIRGRALNGVCQPTGYLLAIRVTDQASSEPTGRLGGSREDGRVSTGRAQTSKCVKNVELTSVENSAPAFVARM